MIKKILLFLILFALSLASWNGKFITTIYSTINSSLLAIKIAASLALTMALWLGLMRIAEEIGLVKKISQFIQPILRKIFPEIPEDHPAMGAMSLNISANMFGLGNAATPFGLRAMNELEKLNDKKSVASNAMCTFLTINTSSVQLLPTTAIAILAAGGCTDPTSIILPAFLATCCSTLVGIASVKTLEKFSS